MYVSLNPAIYGENGDIKSKKFIELLNEDNPHISKFYKNKENVIH